ncbi:MAG: hypothetical protein HKN00_01925 [Flavobacteriaceae bacterium]|nr:hypothetical protein [Bacteroidia bacterium]MBT8287731.1 hypothetical protein [Bacteroidia bacterium]NNF73912.1 hypothetical protein [Flavobacteriaceae bacterium]NNK71862.1 hypothetical protein [Flavobacteriaceae bacterium]
MKTYYHQLVILVLGVVLLSCKGEVSKENSSPGEETKTVIVDGKDRTQKQADGLTLLKGDFLYMADAAVLQTHREIYAVVIDEKMHELDEMVKEFKKEPTDMVPVEIRGKISPKPEGEEGWPFRVEIKEILGVSPPNPKTTDIIKIGQ